MNKLKVTWIYEMPKEPGIKCMNYSFIKMTEKKIIKACQGGGGVFLAHQTSGMSEEQHRALYKPMNQDIRRNGRER